MYIDIYIIHIHIRPSSCSVDRSVCIHTLTYTHPYTHTLRRMTNVIWGDDVLKVCV